MVRFALGLRGALGSLSHPMDLVSEVVEVVRADGYGKDFVDNGREVSQGSNRCQRRRVVKTKPAGGGQNERVFNSNEWHTTVVE